jgi:hypothetical protein
MSNPAGWYPQPDGQQRYWDGQQWTEHLAPGVPAVTPQDDIASGKPAPAIAASGGRRFGVADSFGWGGLAVAVLFAALTSGFSGAAMMFGLFALVVGVVALARGRVGWARLGSRAGGGAALGVALVAMTVGAIAAPPSKTSNTASVAVQTSTASKPDSPTPTSSGPTSAGVSTPTTTAPTVSVAPSLILTHTTGGIVVNAAGAVLPNHARTPGAVNPSVSQASIGQTICVSGWTATVRPSSSVTTELKVAQLASGYTYKGDTATGDYEEDHLISLEIGGAPSAEANLWPEPYNTPEGARVKDVVENKLHTLVCDHAISLATAQRAIAANWWVAYQTYVTAPAPGLGPAPAPAPVQGVHPGAFCSPDGELGYTVKGTPMRCSTTASDSRDRWRAA